MVLSSQIYKNNFKKKLHEWWSNLMKIKKYKKQKNPFNCESALKICSNFLKIYEHSFELWQSKMYGKILKIYIRSKYDYPYIYSWKQSSEIYYHFMAEQYQIIVAAFMMGCGWMYIYVKDEKQNEGQCIWNSVVKMGRQSWKEKRLRIILNIL